MSAIGRSGFFKLFYEETREISSFIFCTIFWPENCVCCSNEVNFSCVLIFSVTGVCHSPEGNTTFATCKGQVSAEDTCRPICSAFSWRLTLILPLAVYNKKKSRSD